MLGLIALQVAVGWWLVRYLILHDRGPKEPSKILWATGWLGVAAIVASIILESLFVPESVDIASNGGTVALSSLLAGSFLIGAIEELAIALPLALLIYRKGYFNDVTDGITYFAISATVFSVLEDIGYMLSYGSGVGIIRIIFGPFAHVGFSIIIGLAIAQHKLLKRSAWVVIAGFAAAITLHALYDFGLFYHQPWSVIASLCISVFVNLNIFLSFRRAQNADRKLGLAASKNNNFCSHCGQPNPKHFLFCTNCGQRT